MSKQIHKIAIVGGGTAGWSAAALLAKHYQKYDLQIVLIESPIIAPVGVGEATVPAILNIHRKLGIDEAEFIGATNATFKLGIEFHDWHRKGKSFFHPFSDFGVKIQNTDFHQCWLKLLRAGSTEPIQHYSLSCALAQAGKFALPDIESPNPLAWYGYAYHFDASRYAAFLRRYSESLGVRRVVGTVIEAVKNPHSGELQTLLLHGGEVIAADFFIDCSGFQARLLSGEYQVGFEDWSHWLPCNKAWAVQTETSKHGLPPFTVSRALSAGWKWEIPLQNRYGNGYAFASEYIDTEAALDALMHSLTQPLSTEPKLLSFQSGIRHPFWVKNCAAIGLASGFIEPLESTSISLMHTGIEKIIAHLPDLTLVPEGLDRANQLNRLEWERIRDFIVLHYWASGRRDSDFWRHFSEIELPAKLSEKIAAFKENGRLISYDCESFREPSWLAMYSGFGIVPTREPAALSSLSMDKLHQVSQKMRSAILTAAQYAPAHREFLGGLNL